MLTSQRKKLLLDRLAAEGQLVAKALALELDTSEDTIRRDLRELAAEGKLQRVHGGALPASAAMGDLALREEVSVADKVALGRFGATLIQPEVMMAPIAWLLSAASNGVTGRRFIGKDWDSALPASEAAKKAGAPAGWDINAPKPF